FRHVQNSWVTYTVTHAHNDYLELTAGTGLIGALLLFVPIFILLVLMIWSFITDTRRYRPAVILGCVGGTLAILIHSAADFNLHIPANALVFAVILGIGYKAACLERRAERSQKASIEPAVVVAHVHRSSHHSAGKPQ
ncbi:MAG: O-antigen ligase family protein, partial [Terriglobia bacterium]